MASHGDASRELFLGLLALEQELVDREQLVAAFETWKASPGRVMGEIMIEAGVLDHAKLASLDRAVEEHFAGPAKKADLSSTVAYESPNPAGGSGREMDVPTAGSKPRFQILRSHARGGLGEVFLALDPELRRQVALKELQAYHAHNPVSQTRFLLEAEVTGRLEHPGIVPVYGLGRHPDGRPFYVMRFIEGETLKAAIDRHHSASAASQGERERDLAFRRLLRCVIAACNAVAFAHSRGVVHRDLKPENIMLGRFGETLVVDWGIAKAVWEDGERAGDWSNLSSASGDSSLTRPGSAVGTPRYMSPEQALGELDRVAPASDVYSLGATLYCLLVGHSPFPEGDVDDVLARVQRGIFPAPRRIRRDVDATLEAICLKAMSPRPEDRHASCLELADELEAWLADVRYRGEQVQAINEMKGSLTRLCLERAHNLLDRGKHGEGMLWLARALENLPQDSPALERVVRASLGSWHARSALMERCLQHGGDVLALAFSPDGHRLATTSSDRTANLWDVATRGRLTAPLIHDQAVAAVAFTRDGKTVATAGQEGVLTLWNTLTGCTESQIPTGGTRITSVRFDPTGTRIAVAGCSAVPCLWSVPERESLGQEAGDRAVVLAAVFSPDGKHLATARDDGQVCLLEALTGQLLGKPLDHRGAVSSVAFSPDGSRLATGCHDGKARVWSLVDQSVMVELSLPSAVVIVDFNPSGDVLATAGEDGAARLWDPRSGSPFGEPLCHRERIECLAFNKDGTILATGSRDLTARLWDTTTGLPLGPPLEHRGTVHALAFSPDGKRLATGSADGQARYWKVAPQIPGEVERISCWVRVTTDLDFDSGDAIHKLDPALGWELRRRLHELGGPPPKKLERW
jgi:WD40 repeat protein/serine/threonine protein kinase